MIRPVQLLELAAAGLFITGGLLWTIRSVRGAVTGWFNRSVLRAVHRFHVRLDRYKLVSKRTVRDELMQDRKVHEAMRQHCRERGVSDRDARVRVEHYIDEIVPFFHVLSYYKLGYNISRALIRLLYRVSAEYQDREALDALPRQDVVLYLMNHRSNMDYVVAAYVLAHGVSISYAVGEWARVWPLEYVFKSFGAYFVRRGFHDTLYHTVLERYVQLITKNGVTQGIFLEGGLTRTGKFRSPKLGLFDYSVRTVLDPAFTGDIWLVPVAINYDRVLEDRTLIQELLQHSERPGRLRQLATVVHYVLFNTLRLLTGNLKRYGRVAINFGTPLSVREWSSQHPGALTLSQDERLPILEQLANEVMDGIAEIMPVTPVPLVAAALLSFCETIVDRRALLARLDEYRDHLLRSSAKLIQEDRGVEIIFDRAWRTLRMRRLVVREGERIVILPSQRPLLEYYANSIAHLLPDDDVEVAMDPSVARDTAFPRLGNPDRSPLR
ncbi:MAG: 1-acyl-sn-glycerol-3-phosphate acyltransferase [Gemmatimonadales bacterium]